MSYTYQRELFNDVIEEMKPLLELHYEEVCFYKDKLDLNPDYHLYEVLESVGALHLFTARTEEGELVGYIATLIQKNLHYSDHIYAVNDVIYVDEKHRHTEVASTMISKLEEELKTFGVSVMTFHMKTFKTFETLMKSLGFEKQEFMYGKFIKED